ncbi:MAG: hypothetical protein M5U19_02015 [Microthrixaceae bacterium]|nr:hypothetical protein [Microthrixaceae bacterium]
MTNPPTPTQAAIDSAPAIHDLPANFMLDAPTYIAAAEVGYEGISFYVAGRGGVLGDVDADAVTEAFVFFPAETISTAWEATAGLESRDRAANRFAEAAHRWAAEHMTEERRGLPTSRRAGRQGDHRRRRFGRTDLLRLA